METDNTTANINETESGFLKINKPLAELAKKKERTYTNEIINETGDITTDTTQVQRHQRDYYKELYAKKLFFLAFLPSCFISPPPSFCLLWFWVFYEISFSLTCYCSKYIFLKCFSAFTRISNIHLKVI